MIDPKGHKRLTLSVAAMLLFILAGGCATMQKQKAEKTEQLLAAAGFHMQLADTPEKVAHLNKLPQHKLFPQERDGKIYYVYADAISCQCLYVGNQANYQEFEKLAVQERIAEDQQIAAEMDENAAMDWSMWGPWGPLY